MHTFKNASRMALVAASLFFFSCQNDEVEVTPNDSIVPESFAVDIPSSISNDNANNGGRMAVNGRYAGELQGDNIYHHLTHFIRIGERSAELVQEIMQSIRKNGINRAMSLSYASDDDGRVKNLVVKENVSFEGTDYAYELTVTDADAEGNADGGKAMQIFWNTNPVEGVAILKPYNIDRSPLNEQAEDAIYRIDYSETGDQGYDKHMIVQIAGLPGNFQNDVFWVDNLKMFVGKRGDVVDVYGNSNHPDAKLFTAESGYGWAFVASAVEGRDFGVAEVGLPFNTVDSPVRSIIMEEYAIRSVFEREIEAAFPNASQDQIDYYLQNTNAPGFFEQSKGFVAAGESPDAKYAPLLENISQLSPYNPKEIMELEISFK